MRATDLVLVHVRIAGTVVEGKQKAILVNVGGGAEGSSADLSGGGESASREPFYQTIGIVGRPEPPSLDGQAEAIAERNDDGLIPLCSRDLRLSALVSLDVGEFAFVQYGGGFLSLGYGAGRKGTIARLYAPAGAPVPGGHELKLDPGGLSPVVKLSHLAGAALELTNLAAKLDAPSDVIAGDPNLARALVLADEFLDLMKGAIPVLTPLVAAAVSGGTITPEAGTAFTEAAALFMAGAGKTTKFRAQ